ncbi:MAG: glycosyltransferase [Aquabacterium sp.]|nr:glycosyltransferase [Aquabacterium sp.]
MTTQFHRIWLGPRPMPQAYEDHWLSWQRQFPQARFTTWGNADIGQLTRTRHKIAEATTWAGKSDIARYEILHTHGGIYLDCDMQPYHWFDPAGFGDDLVVARDFLVIDGGTDMTAYRKDLFMDYTRHLYLDHGHPTIFSEGIRAVCGSVKDPAITRPAVHAQPR